MYKASLLYNWFYSKLFPLQITNTIASTTSISSKPQSSIIIERHYDGLDNDLADAVLDHITNYDGMKYIEYRRFFIVTHHEQVLIEPNPNLEIYCRIDNCIVDTKNVSSIRFELFSYKIPLSELRNYVDRIVENYRIKKLNKLGNRVFYFDEVMQSLPIDIDGNIQYGAASKTLKFNMTPFITNKTLDNMFGPDIKLVIQRLRWFLNKKDWYIDKGIPYTFGLLIHGEPGCGKTSLVKAIANETGRHPFNIKFHDFLTQTQMNQLFFNDRVYINDTQESYILPQDKRLYSIEEIDCMSDMVASREIPNQYHTDEEPIDQQDPFAQLEQLTVPMIGKSKSTKISTLAKKDVLKKMQQVKTNNEKLTLGFVLNILDGVLEVPGRVLIMTTNYIDKLDRALIRPGRIDLILDFKKTTRATIMEMYAHFYEIVVNPCDFENIDDLEYSPAEINQIFFRNIDNPRAALEELSR